MLEFHGPLLRKSLKNLSKWNQYFSFNTLQEEHSLLTDYHPQRSCGKVIISQVCVKNSVHRGVSAPACTSCHMTKGVSVQGGPIWGVSVQESLCPGVSLSGGSLSRGVSVQGEGGSLSRGSLSRGSLSRGSLSGGLCPGVSVWGYLSGGLCLRVSV